MELTIIDCWNWLELYESESLHEDSKADNKTTTTKGKGKVSVATVDNTSQQIQQLQGAVKSLKRCCKVISN